MTRTPQPAATASAACTIQTDQAYVTVQVGPGLNRGAFTSLPVNEPFDVVETGNCAAVAAGVNEARSFSSIVSLAAVDLSSDGEYVLTVFISPAAFNIRTSPAYGGPAMPMSCPTFQVTATIR